MQKLGNISAAIFNNSYYHNKMSLNRIIDKFSINAENGCNYDNYHKLNRVKQSKEEFEAVFFHRYKWDRLKDYKNRMYCISDHVALFYKSEKMSSMHCKRLKLSRVKTGREQYEN